MQHKHSLEVLFLDQVELSNRSILLLYENLFALACVMHLLLGTPSQSNSHLHGDNSLASRGQFSSARYADGPTVLVQLWGQSVPQGKEVMQGIGGAMVMWHSKQSAGITRSSQMTAKANT